MPSPYYPFKSLTGRGRYFFSLSSQRNKEAKGRKGREGKPRPEIRLLFAVLYFVGEERNTSSPRNACGGGYVFTVVDLLLSGTFFLGVC